jgi:aryl-alcohol dehydrogenase-like predicted oxidoreductase
MDLLMEYKNFSTSGEKISLLGFGAWGIGGTMWIGATDVESKKALHRAVQENINFFDSALVYGHGHSERLIGEVERECGKRLFISSKIPSKKFEWPAGENSSLKDSFPKEHIIRSTERSLRNLGREYIDLQQFHVWNDRWADQDEWKEAIQELKDSGKVRYFGISINDHQSENGIEAGKSGLIDSFQVIFNIFDQSPADTLFPFCNDKKISVIARVPFDEGSLTGLITRETIFPKGDWRHRYFRGDRREEIERRIGQIWEDARDEVDSLPEAALRFIVSFDAITSVIPGMRSEKHLLDNLQSVSRGPLSAECVGRLKKHRWIRNFYD